MRFRRIMNMLGRKADEGRALDLKLVGRALRQRMERISARTVEPDLVVARLADTYRDAGVSPPPPSKIRALLEGLDGEGWRRLDLIVSVLTEEPAILADVATQTDAVAQIRRAFLPLAKKRAAVTLAMTSESPLRIEEFARQLAAKLNLEFGHQR
jgi:hypothetical protein